MVGSSAFSIVVDGFAFSNSQASHNIELGKVLLRPFESYWAKLVTLKTDPTIKFIKSLIHLGPNSFKWKNKRKIDRISRDCWLDGSSCPRAILFVVALLEDLSNRPERLVGQAQGGIRKRRWLCIHLVLQSLTRRWIWIKQIDLEVGQHRTCRS